MSPSERVAPRYTTTAIALHWLIAVLVMRASSRGAGGCRTSRSSRVGPRVDAFNLHKSIGLVLLALMLFRLGWRIGASAAAAAGDAARGRRGSRASRTSRCTRRCCVHAARRVSRIGVERLSGQVVRHHAAGVGGEDRSAEGPHEQRPPRDELDPACAATLLHVAGALKHALSSATACSRGWASARRPPARRSRLARRGLARRASSSSRRPPPCSRARCRARSCRGRP